MKGILNLLAKAKLVELSEEERVEAGIMHEEEPLPVDETPPPAVPEPPPVIDLPPPADPSQEQRPLEEIYKAAKVPPSPFPAEKLLKLLDGLKALDASTRKAAVMAMDSADDSWQISDCVADAQQKTSALTSYKHYMSSRLASAEKESAERIAETGASLERTTAEIRRQISELEKLLEREISKSAQQATTLEASMRSEREAAARETRRVDGEIERLNEIIMQFSAEK